MENGKAGAARWHLHTNETKIPAAMPARAGIICNNYEIRERKDKC